MIRFRYLDRYPFPAPFVYVSVRCAETGLEVTMVPAQIDPGADRTVLPATLITDLQLVPVGHIHIAGFGGEPISYPSYIVDVAIHSQSFVSIKAVSHEGEPAVLLGRDVLNHYRIVLDGPQLALEID